jgi:hypothetical protein
VTPARKRTVTKPARKRMSKKRLVEHLHGVCRSIDRLSTGNLSHNIAGLRCMVLCIIFAVEKDFR